jgi:rhodanese-related sulfurtransferase
MAVKHVSVKDAHASQSHGAVYVDVRSIPEFAEGHPQGAVNVPLLHLDERSGQLMPNRDFLPIMKANFGLDAPLLIGCKVGGRSAQAAQMLVDSGFADVTNVLGGFHGARDPFTGVVRAEGWTQANLPVEPEPAPGTSYRELSAKSERSK